MTLVTDPQGLDRANGLLSGSHCELRLGVCLLSRLFYVAPGTTARFSRFDYRSRGQSPPSFAMIVATPSLYRTQQRA
jgi:hypothetical protein